MKKRLIAIVTILSMMISPFGVYAAQPEDIQEDFEAMPEEAASDITESIDGSSAEEDVDSVVSPDGSFAYRIEDGGATIAKYTGPVKKSVSVPGKLSGYPVKDIGEDAFSDMSGIESVILPESVTLIGTNAFSNCKNLKTVVMPGATTIEALAFFQDVSLEEVFIAEGTQCIKGWAFSGCTGLKRVYLPSSLMEIEKHAFQNCSAIEKKFYAGDTAQYNTKVSEGEDNGTLTGAALQQHHMGWAGCLAYEYDKEKGEAVITGCFSDGSGSLTVPSTAGGYKVTALADECFRGNTDITSVTISEGVTAIGDYCFYHCTSLEAVSFPSTLKSIGDNAFAETNLVNADIPEGVESIGDRAFCSNMSLESATVPATVTSLGEGVFSETTLKRAEIKANITTLPNETFVTPMLESVVLPETLTVIGESAFENCMSLKEINLPAGVTEIKYDAFSRCMSLKRVILPEKLVTIGEGAFSKASSLAGVFIPKSVKTIGKKAFENLTSLDVYYGGSESDWLAMTVATDAFDASIYPKCNKSASDVPASSGEEIQAKEYECTYSGFNATIKKYNGKATDLKIPSKISEDGKEYTVVAIADDAFKNAFSLVNVTVPEGVKSIGAYAFSGCGMMKTIALPDTLTEIGEHAFDVCSFLKEIEIPKNVSTIGNLAFQDCSELRSVTLKGKPTSFGEDVFRFCTSLETFEWPDSMKTIPVSTFYNCASLKSVSLPDNLTTIESDAFGSCSSLEEIILPDSLTTIKTGAFYGCAALRSVDIPNGVSVDGGAFQKCTGLAYVRHPGNIVNKETFKGCTNLRVVYFDKQLNSVAQDAFEECGKLTDVYYKVDSNPTVSATGNDAFAGAAKHQSWDEDDQFFYGDFRCRTEASGDITITAYVGTDGNVVIPDTINGKKVTALRDGLFVSDETIRSVVIGKNVTSGIKFKKSSVEKVVINAPVDALEDESFLGCTMLKEIELPESLKTIGGAAFSSCRSLSTIDIPSGVISIGESAFSSCSSLESVILPSGLTVIESSIFTDCPCLESIVIPSGVTEIGSQAFGFCYGLKTIVLPAIAGDKVGESAFYDCYSLQTVYYRGASKPAITEAENDAVKNANWSLNYTGADSISFSQKEIILGIGEKAQTTVSVSPVNAAGEISYKALEDSVVKLTPDSTDSKKIEIEGLKSSVTRVSASSGGAVGYINVYVRYETPKAEWDGSVYLTGLEPGEYYEIDGIRDSGFGDLKADSEGKLRMVITAMGMDMTMVKNWFENTHTIIHISKDNEKLNSLPQTIEIGKRGEPAVPEEETEVVESDMNQYNPVIDVLDENNNPVTLTLWVKKSVSFNNALHKTNFDKDKRKWTRDVTVSVNCSISAYADPVIKLKNNKVVQVKAKKIPSVYLSFKVKKGVKATKAQKKVIKKLNKQLKKQGFAFVINPSNLGLVTLQPKYNKKFTKVTKLSAVIGDRTVKLSKKDFGFEFAADGKSVRIFAKGSNYVGEQTLPITQ